MNEVNMTQIAIEAVMLLGGFLAMYWKQRVAAEHRFTKLETMVSILHTDHGKLEVKLEGIDKSIQEVHGRISRVKEKIAPAA